MRWGRRYVDPGVAELVDLVRRFLAGSLDPGPFTLAYQSRYQELGPLSEHVFAALDRLFFVCEDFYDDVSLRDPGEPDEADLRAAAERALSDLGDPAGWGG